jgi:hypothetical protein
MIVQKVYDAQRRHNYEEFTDEICETVQAQYGTGGGNVPIVLETLVFDESQITCPTNGLNPHWGAVSLTHERGGKNSSDH